MTAQIIDGRKIAETLKSQVTLEFEELEASGIRSGLATISVGEDYGAKAYERRIGRVAAEIGMPYHHVELPVTCSQEEVLATIGHLNADPDITGILVLRPLPSHISEPAVFGALSPIKDIEAVHPENAGLLALGTPRYIPSTAASTFHVLDQWLEETGEDASDFYHRSLIVVVGRSNNVGKPAVSLAYDRQAAVESVDEWASANGRLGWHTRRADVLIVAAGSVGLIRSEHIREGAVVLDVGTNPVRDPQSDKVRMVGDVAFEEVSARARAITPVPGGIGPVTDVWLVRNAVSAAHNATNIDESNRKARHDTDHHRPDAADTNLGLRAHALVP
jgi:methylenetetrahydrofolate dehydrogenase (NADP+)/methenyltetrahydrofolate cyclohydrolase